tara:strand:+ start:3409 stop:5667 length:2259 start_codon:yes stop_codon:yes gene_type:complete
MQPDLGAIKNNGTLMEPYLHLVRQFKDNNIKWCSWKSNEHLLAGLQGDTDVDMLFFEGDRHRVINLMHDCGFILFSTAKHRSYPGIIDFISIDAQNGKILHAHAHFLLTVGEKYLKSVILPWNKKILETTVPSEINPAINNASPQMEAVLLIVREALKIRWRDIRKTKDSAIWGGKGFHKELEWVKDRATPEEIKACAEEMLNENCAELVHNMVLEGIKFNKLLCLKKTLNNIAKKQEWRRIGPYLALYSIWSHEVFYILTRIAEKLSLSQQMIIRRRVLPGSGVVIAFLGPDGSGKSTVTKTLISQWDSKLDIVHLYFGSGDGHSSFLHRCLKSGIAAGLKIKKILNNTPPSKENKLALSSEKKSSKPSLVQSLWAVTGTLDKKKKIKKALKLRKRGFLVVCDRWPQNQVSGINDGPLLSENINHPKWLFRNMARWEKRQFEILRETMTPDVVFRLIPSLDVAINRKPENKDIAEIIERKINLLKDLTIDQNKTLYDIDADKPFDAVMTDVRYSIWNHIQKKPVLGTNLYECIGLPGAGKTTVCREVIKSIDIKSIDHAFSPEKPISKIKKAVLTIWTIILDPIIYALIIKLAFDYKLWKKRVSLGYLFRLPVQKLRLKKAIQSEVYLVEQLILQNIWSAFVSADIQTVRPDYLTPLIAQLYRDMDGTIFYFDITPHEASGRVLERQDGKSRFDNLPESEISKYLDKTQNLMRDIVRAASYAGLSIVQVNASLPINQNIANTILPVIKDNK